MKTMLLAALLLAACTPQPVVPQPDAADAMSPPPPPPNSDDACGHAYAHLFGAGCTPVGPKTGTWVDACRVDRQNGLFPLGCINTVVSRQDAEERCKVHCL